MKTQIPFPALIALTSIALPSAGATAMNTNDNESFILEEIVVTAQKRTQDIQDIPSSISAFDSKRLETTATHQVQDIQFLSPGINVGQYASTPLITARGIGNDNITPVSDPGIAVHVDGVYLGRRAHQVGAFFDLERIEVLKGPQGSLYGRNATGGAINLVTKSPTESFDAGVKLTAGSYEQFNTQGFVSGSLSNSGDTRGRIAFSTASRDGYTRNLFNGDRYDNQDLFSVRTKLVHNVSNTLTLSLSADYTKDQSQPGILTSRATMAPTTGEFAGGQLVEGRRVNVDGPNDQEIKTGGFSIGLEWELDDIDIHYKGAYRDMSTRLYTDLDGTNITVSQVTSNPTDIEQFSQDIYATGGTEEHHWIAGLSALKEQGDAHVYILNSLFDFSLVLGAPDIVSTSLSVFGEYSFFLTEKLEITFGARASRDKKELDEFTSFNGLRSNNSLSDEWTSFTPRLSLQYQINENISSYMTIGTGFKSGTFNVYSLQPDSVDPEEVTNYEFGIKSQLLDQSLQLNASIFHMDYQDLQVFQTRDQATLVENATDAFIRGVELDMNWLILLGVGLNASVSYLDTEYEEFISQDPTRNNQTFDVSGNQLIGAPEWSTTLGLYYETALSDTLTTLVRLDYRYQSEVYFRPFNDIATSQNSHDWVNASINFDFHESQWKLQLFGKNLTDELVAGHKFLGTSDLGTLYTMPLQPRTYGIAISYGY